MFYQSEFRSAISRGQNPIYASTRRYEVDANGEFLDYMKNHTLKIDFIDDSVDIRQTSMRDYIGSARIDLRELLRKGKLDMNAPIIDDLRNQTGSVHVKLAIHDVNQNNTYLLQSGNFNSQESYKMYKTMTENIIK
mmetsp:Transcript_16383/g.11526  ORF Transcript_16383/g.11526 Transcript_16383/m.11526 type:complete len:136 (-) Transcript_16383:1886-2293(-)